MVCPCWNENNIPEVREVPWIYGSSPYMRYYVILKWFFIQSLIQIITCVEANYTAYLCVTISVNNNFANRFVILIYIISIFMFTRGLSLFCIGFPCRNSTISLFSFFEIRIPEILCSVCFEIITANIINDIFMPFFYYLTREEI